MLLQLLVRSRRDLKGHDVPEKLLRTLVNSARYGAAAL